MAFCETLSLLCARGGQHKPGPTMPPFYVYSPFPTSDPSSYPVHEVFQFEFLGLILNPKLTMHLATVESIQRAPQGQVLALDICYSLWYDKNSSQLTLTQTLGLWKAMVLPHFLQNLRYIQSETEIKQMQTSLNLSTVLGPALTCIWRPHWTFGRYRNPSPPINKIRSPHPTTF